MSRAGLVRRALISAAATAGAAAFSAPALGAEIDNARAYCARENAHWVGGEQQCACNSGYVQSGNTCVSAGSGSAGSAGGGFAVPPNAFTNAAAGVIGNALGNALVSPLSNPYQGHVRPKPVVGDDDESAPNPDLASGMGTASDILKQYQGEADDGAVRLSGETPQLLRAAEEAPLISGGLGDVEGLSLPPDSSEAPSQWPAVSLQNLKDWGAMAEYDAKDVISRAAALEKDFSDSAAGDAVSAATLAHDTVEVLANQTQSGDAAEATIAMGEVGSSGKILGGIDAISKGTRFVNLCANGGEGACADATWGVGLGMTGAGTTMTIGMGLGKSGRDSLNAGYGKLNDEMRALETEGNKAPKGDDLATLPSQKKLNDSAGNLFEMF